MLRPAVARLVAAGRPVVGVARTAADLEALGAEFGADAAGRARVVGVPADYLDAEAMLRRLVAVHPHYSAALVYAPAATEATLATLRLLVDGPVVELLVSANAAPDVVADAAAGAPQDQFELSWLPIRQSVPWRHLLLGWTADGRWHTPEEISAAALDVLDSGQEAVLGRVRPWASRPAD